MSSLDERTEPCRSCGALVVWAHTGKAWMPIDSGASTGGTVAVGPDARGDLAATVLAGSRLTATRKAGIDLHTSHFATCPHASTWRKGR